MEAIIIVPFVFGSIVWVIERIVNRRALNRERLKLIEKGGDLKDLLYESKRSSATFNSLKYGLVAVGLALGTLLGSYFEQNQILANKEVGYVFAIALFVGGSLILNHYFEKKENKN